MKNQYSESIKLFSDFSDGHRLSFSKSRKSEDGVHFFNNYNELFQKDIDLSEFILMEHIGV